MSAHQYLLLIASEFGISFLLRKFRNDHIPKSNPQYRSATLSSALFMLMGLVDLAVFIGIVFYT